MSARCPMCESPVDWVTVTHAANFLGCGEANVRRLIREGRLPGTELHHPPLRQNPFYRIPLKSVIARKEMRS